MKEQRKKVRDKSLREMYGRRAGALIAPIPVDIVADKSTQLGRGKRWEEKQHEMYHEGQKQGGRRRGNP